MVVAGALSTPRAAYAQNAARTDNDYFNFVELNVFGGVSYYAPVDAGLGTRYTTDGVIGGRFTENIWNYFALEEGFAYYSPHDLRFKQQIGSNTLPPFDIRQREVGVNFLGYFTPRDKTVRPFLVVGVEGTFWDPSRHAKHLASGLTPPLGLQNFTGAQLRYGAGIKWQVSRRIGVRADLRASLGRNPNYGLPNNASGGGYYIPDSRFIQGLETTIGMTLYRRLLLRHHRHLRRLRSMD
jgi:hypothetical protein